MQIPYPLGINFQFSFSGLNYGKALPESPEGQDPSELHS